MAVKLGQIIKCKTCETTREIDEQDRDHYNNERNRDFPPSFYCGPCFIKYRGEKEIRQSEHEGLEEAAQTEFNRQWDTLVLICQECADQNDVWVGIIVKSIAKHRGWWNGARFARHLGENSWSQAVKKRKQHKNTCHSNRRK